MICRFLLSIFAWSCATNSFAAEPFPKFRPQEIDTSLTVGYATVLEDVNRDGKPDIVVVDSKRVIWFENPTWKLHTIIEGQTKPDNVCIAAHDIDGDGRVDFALGADWRPFDTSTGGTLQWLRQGASPSEPWTVHAIGEEPTLHRIRWADLNADGAKELLVVPLMGRGTTKPHFAERPLRVLSFSPPAKPATEKWPVETINDELHVAHNFDFADVDRDGKPEILIVSFEGVSLLKRGANEKWSREKIGAGNQETSPNKGASEIKYGTLSATEDYIATIEPWHGFQVVVYTRPPRDAAPGTLWTRHVLDDELAWGHAVWCANVDGDAEQELIIGVRDNKDTQHRSGLRIYDPFAGADGKTDPARWKRHVIDPGGVAIEDLTAGDLNGDGRVDIIAVGRATKNVKIYWNEK